MKTHSKFMRLGLVASTSVISFSVMASTAFAITPAATTTPATQVNFCKDTASIGVTQLKEIDARTATTTASWQTLAQARVNNLTSIQKENAALRLKADEKRKAEYAKLTVKAKTDSQKAAVAAYQKATDAAVAKKRAARDASLKVFIDGINTGVDAKHKETTKQIGDFRLLVVNISNTAKASCSVSNPKVEAIKAKFVADMKAARLTYKNTTDSKVKIDDLLKTLQAKRDLANRAAEVEYKASIASAKATLKTAVDAKSTKPTVKPSAKPGVKNAQSEQSSKSETEEKN